MESGVFNEESLSITLRGISQRRRDGILEISYPDHLVQLIFSQGKLAQVVKEGEDPVEAVFSRLLSAGYLNSKAAFSEVANNGGSLSSLWSYIKKSGVAPELDEGTFRRVIRNLLLDSFLALDLDSASVFTFRPHPSDPDLEFSPAIAVGQLLTNGSEQSRDKEILATYLVEDAGFKVGSIELAHIDVDGQDLIEIVKRWPGVPVDELFKATLLSRLEYQSSLVKLLEQGALEVVPAVPQSPSQAPTDGSAALQVDSLLHHATLVTPEETATTWGFKTANTVIANSLAVAQVLALGFLVAAISLPWLLWQEMLAVFSR